jgi:uncharacterized membrane protein
MSRPLHSTLGILILGILIAHPLNALGQASLIWIGDGTVTDLSANGHVAVGLTNNSLDVFRWTAAGGLEDIGGSTLHLGIGAGDPHLDADGSHICATIAASDSTSITLGLWNRADGWQDLPVPETGIVVDNNLGSAWNISGDGSTVVGLFWVPPARAHGTTWSSAAGPIDLGSQGGDSRANAASHDGSVVVGWSADTTTGTWQPTVWEGGVMTVLQDSGPITELKWVSPDGDILAGQYENPATGLAEAALYFRDAGAPLGWSPVSLGVLPNTSSEDGRSMILDATADASMVIGLNYFSNFSRTDFVWTVDLGMMTISDFMAQAGATFPTTYRIEGLTAVSDDGRYLAGYGYDLYVPGVRTSFIVDFGGVTPVPPVPAASGLVLEPNYPNPFNPSTTVAFILDRTSEVEVTIHDARGHLVRALHRGVLGAGRHTRTWNGRDDTGKAVASGIYLAIARDAEGHRQSQRMTLVK